MSNDPLRLGDYLTHILHAIERIIRYTESMDEPTFLLNELVQDAVIRNFEILGEASSNILKAYPDFAKANPELPLAAAYQLRNALSHGYFKVDYQIVWQTIHANLPALSKQVQDSIATLK